MKTLSISGVIGWDVTAQDVREFLRDAAGADVKFVIGSPGGLVSVGLEIFNLIRNYSGHTTAVLSGFAMSMASYIPLACDHVAAEDNAVYMVHNARGGVWGDHNDILSYGAFVKGLSGLLGKQYTRTTGKTQQEVTDWMDKETFFFGDEILDSGFVHEIIATDKDKDKSTALAGAQAIFTDTMAQLSKDTVQARADMIAASGIMSLATPPVSTTQPPASAGIPQKEVQQMNLQELLAANPAAQAQYDAALAAARKEGVAEVHATINTVAPFLANASYPAIIAATALKVLKGDEASGTLISAVAAVDAVREDAAAAKAAAEAAAAGNTLPQTPAPVAAPGAVVSSEADLDATIAAARKEG
jgi:ATP-dependent protease ClpP protease subunit